MADTNDYKIGYSVEVDSKNMQDLFQGIVRRSKGSIYLNKLVFEGFSITQENMLKAVDSLRVRSNDIIVFLYAGHGHRYKSTMSKWPLMDTMNHPTDFLTVIQKIRNKYARQFIALADCCNNVIPTPRDIEKRLSNDFPYENIRRMFLDSTVKIAASGSEPGQFSYSNDVVGGFFTSSFISNLKKALFSSEKGWKTVLYETRKNVLQKTNNAQKPQFEFF